MRVSDSLSIELSRRLGWPEDEMREQLADLASLGVTGSEAVAVLEELARQGVRCDSGRAVDVLISAFRVAQRPPAVGD